MFNRDLFVPFLFSVALQDAIESLPHAARQSWYLDLDGLLRATWSTLGVTFPQLENALKRLGMKIHHAKCEMYAPTSDP